MSRLRVLLVTSWGTACGIADFAASLKRSVEAADPEVEITPSAAALDPKTVAAVAVAFLSEDDLRSRPDAPYDLVHLNHHDGLHSQWGPNDVRALEKAGIRVVVTYHDTRERLVDCPKLRMLYEEASATIVHEPVEGLRAIYWRQGIPAPAVNPYEYFTAQAGYAWATALQDGPSARLALRCGFKAYPQQPVLGTLGFNFPWKNYDRLAALTAEEGWALVILSNNATAADEARWRAANPSVLVVREFLDQPTALNYLAGCDATAFMYECANTGTSGAIRLGIAARKPVMALQGCRQFRDLWLDEDRGYGLGRNAIGWVSDWPSARQWLRHQPASRYDPRVVALAQQDSWQRRGVEHATLYRALVEGRLIDGE